MPKHSFTLILAGEPELTVELEDALFEAGCDDASLGVSCGVLYLAFDREAASKSEAVAAAIEDVESTGRKVVIAYFDEAEDFDTAVHFATAAERLMREDDRAGQGHGVDAAV